MKILFYGDSNTYGFDPRGPIPGRYDEDNIWPNRLSILLGQGYEIVADGMNGREIPTRDYQLDFLTKAIDREKPDLLGIMLGTNDYVHDATPSVDKVVGHMRQLLEFLKANQKSQAMSILLIAPPPICEAGYDTTDGRLSKAYEKLAAELQVDFVDSCQWNLPLAFDGEHLTERGHEIFAEKIAEYLKEI